MLPSTFDSDPGLRFSKGALAAIVAVFIASGYITTIVLIYAVPNWLFQCDLVYSPSLCSSAFGLLGTIYAFASSPRYKFDTIAGITIALTSSSTAIYAVLLVWMQRKISRVRQGMGTTTYRAGAGITIIDDIPQDGRESQASTAGLYQEPNYYRNYIANMHPTAIHAPSVHSLHEQPSYQSLRDPSPSPPRNTGTYYDLPPGNHSNPDIAGGGPVSPFQAGGPQIGEEEQVSQHLARLLLNTRDGSDGGGGPNASQSTFRIDWRTDDDDDNSPRAGIQLRTRTGSGSRLVPSGKLAQANGLGSGAISPPLARLAPFRGRDGATLESVSDGERGRTGARNGHQRAKSREDRRREIELGFVGVHPAYRQAGGG